MAQDVGNEDETESIALTRPSNGPLIVRIVYKCVSPVLEAINVTHDSPTSRLF